MIVAVVDAESTDLVDTAGLFTISGIILNLTDLTDVEKQIADFKNEVDFVLSESNARTEIEVN